jgi:amidase
VNVGKTLTKEHLVYGYDPDIPPAIEIKPGELLEVETHHRFSRIPEENERLYDDPVERRRVSAVTGPIGVLGARPGEVLKVEFVELTVTEDFGVLLSIPGRGAFAGKTPERVVSKVVSLDRDFVYFTDQIKIPLSPMVGRVGVAPLEGPVPTDTVGPHGGNIDNNHVGEGSAIYLPVFISGGLLALGDFHAAMGDGESLLTGVEVSGKATIRCEVIRDLRLTHPVVVTQGSLMTLADGERLEEAFKVALDNMACLMTERLGLTYIDAAMLISAAADARVCELVNPRVAVKVVIPRSIFSID